ncbi:MAG: hypothetical protein KAX31_02030 [Thermoplasmata archaeon]|nr:hypothetical protein [Thermoplasmata archaeon]
MRDDNKSKKKIPYHQRVIPIAEKIDEVIDSGKHGYASIPDFVKEATRRYLRELGYLT